MDPAARRGPNAGADAAEAIAATMSPPGQVATLILPADVSWSERRRRPGPAGARPGASPVPGDVTDAVAACCAAASPA